MESKDKSLSQVSVSVSLIDDASVSALLTNIKGSFAEGANSVLLTVWGDSPVVGNLLNELGTRAEQISVSLSIKGDKPA